MIRAIITDIEGTTSAISFVHQVLFPYAAEHLPAFIREHAHQQKARAQLQAVAAETGLAADDLEGLTQVLMQWIQEDRKATPLKSLQGMIWEQGYQRGDFKGHIYADAAEYLVHWHDQGLRLYVYSSGSVQAQQLIFGHTAFGDLTPYFSGYFDTRVGSKREVSSYQTILQSLGLDPKAVAFLSDIEAELIAAEEAGIYSCWLVRDGALPETNRPVARDFKEVDAWIRGHNAAHG